MLNRFYYEQFFYEKELDDLAFNYYLSYEYFMNLKENKHAEICLKMFKLICTSQRILKSLLSKV